MRAVTPRRAAAGWRLAAPAALLAVLALVLAARAEAFIYWTHIGGPGSVSRANNDGSGVDTGFIAGAQDTCGVAVNDSHIYWGNHQQAEGTTIGRANLDGSGVDQSFITGANGPCGVAVDEDFLYWNNTAAGAIGRAGLDGSDPNQTFIDPGGFPCGLAVSDTHVYWGDEDAGTIGRAKLDGTGVDDAFITGATAPCGVAVNSAHVYWTNTGIVDPVVSTTIGRANLDGTAVNQSFIDGAGSPCGVAVDDSHLYWANMNFGFTPFSIARASLNGSGVQQHFIDIPGAEFPCGVAVDSRRRSTAVAASCSPAAAALLQPTTCTAVVTDTEGGVATLPTGTVSFSSSAAGSSFDGGRDCELAPTPGDAAACSVTYRPGFGANLVLALYRGDASHEAGDAIGSVAVGRFSLGSLARNPKRGTATLTANVPGPGTVTLSGLATRNLTRQAAASGQVALPIVGTLATRKKLRRRGRAGALLAVRYQPSGGGSQDVELTAIRLVKSKPKPKRPRR